MVNLPRGRDQAQTVIADKKNTIIPVFVSEQELE